MIVSNCGTAPPQDWTFLADIQWACGSSVPEISHTLQVFHACVLVDAFQYVNFFTFPVTIVHVLLSAAPEIIGNVHFAALCGTWSQNNVVRYDLVIQFHTSDTVQNCLVVYCGTCTRPYRRSFWHPPRPTVHVCASSECGFAALGTHTTTVL